MSRALALQPDGKLIVGGSFGAVNGTNRNGIARLNANGSLDGSFQNGMSGVINDGGYSGRVEAVTVQPDGKVLIGGYFTTVNGTARTGFARLDADGALDAGFSPVTIAGGNVDNTTSVNSITLQVDGRVFLGGSFSTVNNTARNNIARLNADGSLDVSFNAGTGVIGPIVYATAIHSDGRLLVGGSFAIVDDAARWCVARLLGDILAPSLDIALSNGFAILTWPESAAAWRLQESPDLTVPNSWISVTQPAVTSGGQISVTVPIATPWKFFRLLSP